MRCSFVVAAVASVIACMTGSGADDSLVDACDPFAQNCMRGDRCVPHEASDDVLDDDAVINVCVPGCDPLAQDCGGSDGCYSLDDDFVCLAAAGDTPIGEPCSAVNDCAKGSVCEFGVPDCPTSMCCTNLCNMDLRDEQCAALMGTTCKPFHQQGRSLPDFGHVGACIL